MEKKGIRELYLELGDNKNILGMTPSAVCTGGGHDEWAMRGGAQ